jgi:hypothetical protein
METSEEKNLELKKGRGHCRSKTEKNIVLNQ